MSPNDRLFSLQELSRPIDVCAENTDLLAQQLADTLRENERLTALLNKVLYGNGAVDGKLYDDIERELNRNKDSDNAKD